jgi:hypothetical protein
MLIDVVVRKSENGGSGMSGTPIEKEKVREASFEYGASDRRASVHGQPFLAFGCPMGAISPGHPK